MIFPFPSVISIVSPSPVKPGIGNPINISNWYIPSSFNLIPTRVPKELLIASCNIFSGEVVAPSKTPLPNSTTSPNASFTFCPISPRRSFIWVVREGLRSAGSIPNASNSSLLRVVTSMSPLEVPSSISCFLISSSGVSTIPSGVSPSGVSPSGVSPSGVSAYGPTLYFRCISSVSWSMGRLPFSIALRISSSLSK